MKLFLFNVRIVLSLLLARELFSNRNLDLNCILHNRLKSLNIPSNTFINRLCKLFENTKRFTEL